MDAAQRAALEELLASTSVRERFTAKLVVVPGSGCLWWTGAVSGRGHGRFWVAPGLVMVAHRVAYALALGVAALADAPLLAHGCDNPLCQHVGPGHVVASCAVLNRGEWLQRRYVIGSPVTDPRGAGVRARVLRDLARQSPAAVAAELDRHAASAGSRRRCGDASCCGSGRVGAAAAAARLVVRGGGGRSPTWLPVWLLVRSRQRWRRRRSGLVARGIRRGGEAGGQSAGCGSPGSWWNSATTSIRPTMASLKASRSSAGIQ